MEPDGNLTDSLQMWSMVVGFLLPPVLAVLMQPTWSNKVRSVIAFLVCVVAGLGTAYFQGDLTGRTFIDSGLVVLVASIATYHGFWKPTRIAPTIEDKTSPSP